MYWLSLTWWKYIFGKPRYSNILRTALCRARNHPCGVLWYNSTGTEPNMTCRNCGDDLS